MRENKKETSENLKRVKTDQGNNCAKVYLLDFYYSKNMKWWELIQVNRKSYMYIKSNGNLDDNVNVIMFSDLINTCQTRV